MAVPSGKGEPIVDADEVARTQFTFCLLESDVSILSDMFTTPAAEFDSFRGVWGPCRGYLLL